MPPIKVVLFVFALLAIEVPASAWDGVEVVVSTGLLRQEVFGAPSPTPGYCYWDKDPIAGPTFHATETDGYGNNECPYPWMVHCDNDSLAYRGIWPLIDAEYVLSSAYRVELTCSVNVTTATRLIASRSVVGNLDDDEHSLSVFFPDGAEVPLLAPGSGPDQEQMDLEPGTYQVVLIVDAYQGTPVGTPIDPYAGSVLLQWEDPGVAVTTTSWSSLKAVFR
jgi:hypothetical protein